MRRHEVGTPGIALGVVGALACGVTLFARLSHPLPWHDAGETVMFATRVLAYGCPREPAPTSP